MYNSIEYSYNYLKTSGRRWQYYRDEPGLDDTNNLIDFLNNDDGDDDNNNNNNNNNSILFKF